MSRDDFNNNGHGQPFGSYVPFFGNTSILGSSRSNTPRPSIAGLAGDGYGRTRSSDQPRADIGEELISGKTATWSEGKDQILMGPFDYMINHPGKDIRSQLIGAFNAWLKVPPESLAIISKVVGMLHTASLL
jgi:hypothetical protein